MVLLWLSTARLLVETCQVSHHDASVTSHCASTATASCASLLPDRDMLPEAFTVCYHTHQGAFSTYINTREWEWPLLCAR